jgi:hypothetical protein
VGENFKKEQKLKYAEKRCKMLPADAYLLQENPSLTNVKLQRVIMKNKLFELFFLSFSQICV